MTPEDNKILTAFVGKCWHEFECKCGDPWCDQVNPDFTTPDGYQLLADEIGKRDMWMEFIRFWVGTLVLYETLEYMAAWESRSPADKSIIVLEAIKAGVFGEVKP